MANVRTQNRSRMQAKIDKSGIKPNVPRAKVPALRPSMDLEGVRSGPRMPSISEPSGGPLARRASTDLATRAIRGEGPGIKDIGSGSTSGSRASLPAPSASRTAAPAAAASRMGLGSKLLGGAGLMAYSKPAGEGSDKPQNYPGEGLQPRAAFPQGSPESSIPAPKKAAPKPVARKAGPSADDDFMADLRASAQRMRDTSADMASKTGRMKSAMEEFQSAADDATDGYKRGGKAKGFKQGGSVGGRGDGKAIRGRTKGRFI